MKTYNVNYIDFSTGNSSSIIIKANTLKEAKYFAQRKKTNRHVTTFVKLRK